MDNENKNTLPEEEKNSVAEAVEETAEEVAETSAAVEEGAENAEDTDEAVAEASEEAAEELSEEELCIICGENKKAEDSDYCPVCEAAMYKSKISVLAWISGVAVIVISIFAFVVAGLISAPAIQALQGDIEAMNKRWNTAYSEYSEVSSSAAEIRSIIGEGNGLALFVREGRGNQEKMIEAYANARSPLDSIYMAMMIYGESAIHDFKGISDIVELYDDFYNSYTLMSEAVDGMLGGAEKNETFAALEALEGKEGINEVFRNYFLFSAADFYKLGCKEELKYIEAAEAAAKAQGKDYSWLYYLEIADSLCQEGEYDLALGYVDYLAENNKNNYRAFDLQMRIAVAKGETEKATAALEEFEANNPGLDTAYALRASLNRCSGDIEKSRITCEEGLVENDFSTEIHRQLALVYLLEGDYLKAYEEAFTADSNATYMAQYYMDNSGYTPQLDNTIYLCATLCKKNNLSGTTNSVYIDQILEYYSSFNPSKQVSAILNGEKTIEEVLTEGVCDLA